MKKVFLIVFTIISLSSYGQFERGPMPEYQEKDTTTTQGDYLIKAAKNLNTAVLMPVLGGGVIALGFMMDENSQPFVISGYVIVATGLIFYFRGTNFIRLAGKKANNKEKKLELGLTSTQNGLSLALKF